MTEYVIIAIYLSSMLFSAIMAFIYRNYLKSRKILILLPFLTLVFLQELILITYRETTSLQSLTEAYIPINITYNIYKPLSVIIFSVIYFRIPFMIPFRKWILLLTTIYLAIYITNYLFIQPPFANNSYLTLTRGLLITCYAVFFLFGYFYLDNLTEEKYWRPIIWITIGVVIFYPVVSISLAFQKYLYAFEATVYGFKLYQLIPQLMSIFMYSCFSYAFYLCKKIG